MHTVAFQGDRLLAGGIVSSGALPLSGPIAGSQSDVTRRLRPINLIEKPSCTWVPAVAALVATVPLLALMGTPTARADTGATVKAQTQRMTDADLGSGQDGWYNPGDHITLSCSKRGQPVKGFFSFNIPDGWDNLWYKTSDGHFVADVDIETGTLDVVAPDCNAAPATNPVPAPSSTKADAAVAKANSMVGTDAFGDVGCGRFVAAAYGVPGIGYNTAKQFRDALASQGRIHTDGTPPKGALVFSESSWDGGAGHVVIARGDSTFVSGGVYKGYNGVAGGGHNVQVLPNWNPAQGATYLGWADAPW
jgi:hypothetical protein